MSLSAVQICVYVYLSQWIYILSIILRYGGGEGHKWAWFWDNYNLAQLFATKTPLEQVTQDIRDFKIHTKTMGIVTIDVLLMHCLEWTSHANLKVPSYALWQLPLSENGVVMSRRMIIGTFRDVTASALKGRHIALKGQSTFSSCRI